LLLICFAALPVCRVEAGEAKPTPEQTQFFESKVRPLLATRCFKCHGPKKQQSELRLDSRAALLQGGESGPAVEPGNPQESLLIRAVRYEELEMPPDRRLDKQDIDTLVRWVQMGAPWPNSDDALLTPRKPGLKVTSEDRQFWSFRPIGKPEPPVVRQRDWVRNPIDQFILGKLEANELTPSEEAARRELIRRLYFDLIGLPPSYEEVESFVSDESPDAYEQLVDRVLSRPQYGERWGRHWLDVVRFADSNGYERDDEKPLAWMYRDYVIRALNADKPYDQFVKEQLAGDELDEVTDDSLTATAFYRLGPWDDEPADKRQAEWDEYDDIVSTTGVAFLGLTIGCARCHDHKFDPIPQADYYSLTAFIRNIRRYGKDKSETHYEKDDDAIFVSLPSGNSKTLAVTERGNESLPTRILIRGDSGNPSQEVQPRFIEVLCRDDEAASPALPKPVGAAKSTGRRSALADWVTSADNPLAARVIVNRLWHYHFGQGIVATPSDFGRTGIKPSHPELLDWLSQELIRREWSLKHVHRLIVTSSTYRQSSRARNDPAVKLDPDNKLLWRQNLRRLEAEAIRDSVLATTGTLNLQMAGRGVFPTLPPEVLATQSRPGAGWDKSPPGEQARRSVYIFVKRTLGVPLLDTFDFASPDSSAPNRPTTTIAPQALILLNSSFMEAEAAAFADRIQREAGPELSEQVDHAFKLALARSPTKVEQEVSLSFLDRQRERDSHLQPLAALCKLLLNLNEFVYVD
jgi:hypothetical protein